MNVLDHKESDDDFTIDRYRLEEEANKQPQLFRHYGKKLAIWSAKVKELKRKLDYTQAACAEIIRNNPKEYGIKKDSDKICLALALEEEDYKAAHDEYISAVQQELYYEHSIKALLQKGSMIKELVSLWLNNYYSNPIIKEGPRNPKVRVRLREENENREDI
jgi:hypothetical protein